MALTGVGGGRKSSAGARGGFRVSWALIGLALTMLGGAVVIVLFSMSATSTSQLLVTATVGLLVAGASAMVGGVLGFLFGIPNSLQTLDTSASQASKTTRSEVATNLGPTDQGPAHQGSTNNRAYGGNTNLEQISDWLTKILVGVTLTQLNDLPQKLQALALFLSPGFVDVPHSDVFAIAVVLYFAIAGFLFGYLYTRLFFEEALVHADIAALGARLLAVLRREADEALSQAQLLRSRQDELDAKALGLVGQQLDQDREAPEFEGLAEVIKGASATVREQVRILARAVVTTPLEPKGERAAPIFQALIASGDDYYDDHGQLGYIFKDKTNPDWAEAEMELTKAIDGRGTTTVFGFYEANRAVCRIARAGNRAGESPYRENILADLRAAVLDPMVREQLEQQPPFDYWKPIADWMRNNNLTMKDLVSSTA